MGCDRAQLSEIESLSRPDVVPASILRRRVAARFVDMNAIPHDLGRFDLIWSCATKHFASPAADLNFVMRRLGSLKPGGVSVHTRELELTPPDETADYGHLAVYWTDDLDRFADRIRRLGFEIDTNWYVSLETPAARWMALPPHPHDDPARLKLVIGDWVSTSVGLLTRRLGGHF
jgi:hypothetical protein